MAMMQCPECGRKISDQANICIYCGYSLRKKRKKALGKRALKIARIPLLAAAILAILFAIWKLLLPDLFVSADGFLSRGDYQRAYEKTSDADRKAMILTENQIAVVCQNVVDSLRDPTSFMLSEAAYTENSQLLLVVVAKNSYGGNVTNYWVYDYEKDGVYKFANCLTDLEQEEYYSWEDANKLQEKIHDNFLKIEILDNLYLGRYDFLPDESLQRINALFAAGKLNDVKLIPITDPVETEAPVKTEAPTEPPAASQKIEKLLESSTEFQQLFSCALMRYVCRRLTASLRM